MPAPTKSELQDLIISSMGSNPMSDILKDEWIPALCDAISKGWDSWISGMKWGGLTVVGLGIPKFSGVGVGGMIIATPLSISKFAFHKDTPEQVLFQTSLYEVMSTQFSSWSSSFVFAGVPFKGDSTASPVSPGVFTASNDPTALSSAGVGVPPSGISKAWQGKLTGFDLPKSDAPKLTDAVGSAIEKAFSDIFLKSKAEGSQVMGPATPGPGAGFGTSFPTGKIV